MKSPNHIAGGFVFTGIFASLSGINIFATYESVIITLIGCLIPDIDYPKSTIGRLLLPLSKWINRRYGHRTLTHSSVALFLSSFVFSMVEYQFSDKTVLATIYGYAYASHLILDMVTLQGIPLLYPFFKNPFVMPANPGFRIRTGDIRAETMVFCIFLLMGIFLQPLFKKGFWTSYNRLFGTMNHLVSEFNRSEDLLEVSYWARKGSESIQGKGYCIEVSENRVVLIEEDDFTVLDKKDLLILKVIPEHTGRQFYFRTKAFLIISLDSLNHFIHDKLVYSIEVNANQPFLVYEKGSAKLVTSYRSEFNQKLLFQSSQDSILLEPFIYEVNPRIALLQQRLTLLKKENEQKKQAWFLHLDHLEYLKQTTQATLDPVKRDASHKQYQKALQIKAPKIDRHEESLLTTEIYQLQQQESRRNFEKQQRLIKQQKLDPNNIPLQFTGILTYIEIQ